MPIKRSSQDWTIGRTVKVGFLSLKVIGFEATPGDYRPDQYMLANSKGVRYTFTPHHGLERIEGLHVEMVSVQSTPVTPGTIMGRYFRNEG